MKRSCPKVLLSLMLYLATLMCLPPADVSAATGSSEDGSLGWWHTGRADAAPEHRFLMGLNAAFSNSENLLDAGDVNRFARFRWVASGSLGKGWELGGGLSLSLNANDAFEPQESLSLGDPFMVLRYGDRWTDELALGAKVRVDIPTGLGAFSLASKAGSLTVQGMMTFDPWQHWRFGVDLGFRLDNSARVFGEALTASQRFAGGFLGTHRLRVAMAAAFSWAWSETFMEVIVDVPVGGSGAERPRSQVRVVLGGRFVPPATPDLSLMVGAEIGSSGSLGEGGGWPPLAPVTLLGMVGWDFGTKPPIPPKPPKPPVKVVCVQRPCPEPEEVQVPGTIDGQVVDAQTGKPLVGARVRYTRPGFGDTTQLTGSPGGRFRTCGLPSGPARVAIHLAGYAPRDEVVVVQAGRPTKLRVRLAPSDAEAVGTLKGTLRFIGGARAAAFVRIPTRKVQAIVDPATGAFFLETETGELDLLIGATGFVTQRHKITLHPGEAVILNVELYPRK